jgi:hypothetical protein
VIRLLQFSTWLEQYYSTGFETALKVAGEFVGNSKYDIPLTSKEKRNVRRKRMFDYENGDEPVTNPENRIRKEYYNVMVKIKSNQIYKPGLNRLPNLMIILVLFLKCQT